MRFKFIFLSTSEKILIQTYRFVQLKLRLERMDRRVNLQKLRPENPESSVVDSVGPCSPPTLNSTVNSLPSTSEQPKVVQPDSLSPQYGESFKIRLNTTGGVTTVKQEIPDKVECKEDPMIDSWENKRKRKSDPTPLNNSSKRRRNASSSSTVSNDTSSTLPESFVRTFHSPCIFFYSHVVQK